MPGGWVDMNGDDHERILTLEEDMKRVLEQLSEMKGSARTWALIVALLVSPAVSAATSWALRTQAPPSNELNESVHQLLKEIRKDRMQHSMEADK